MSAISIAFTPGYLFPEGDYLTSAKLRLMLTGISIQLNGSLGSAQIEDGAVTESKLAAEAVTITKIGIATFTPDATGAAPFASGFLANLYVTQKARPVVGRTNLVIANNAATPNTKADITADEVVLLDASGNYFLATAVNLTVDITAAGASNGLDTLPGTGAAASTWYYFYLIYNGTTVQGLISTSASAPTLPNGFTYSALVGAVYNNGSSQFNKFRIQGRRCWMNGLAAASAAAMTSYGSFASFSLATGLPSIAKAAWGSFACSTGTVTVGGDSTGSWTVATVATATAQFYQLFTFPNAVWYIRASSTSATLTISVTGFEF